ncbi:hypothetical protein F66182_2417 [Fusarium sp. NRRL 66182]|nr:hypothetical protein F66182_2417 [Fusarium sp. NRRL 66182]
MMSMQHLLHESLWRDDPQYDVGTTPGVALRFARIRSICRNSDLTVEDIRNLTPKFWELHRDLISTRDMTAWIIVSVHFNLCIGTLSIFSQNRPDLSRLIDKLLRFEACGQFMLAEVGHGLDARNMETTATLQSDGSFDLHTPRGGAAKCMPPTSPQGGVPLVAVVFARLMVEGEDRGVKPFVVWLSDSRQMYQGITSRPLPTRTGCRPLDHALTTFNHVRLRPEALLGSGSKPKMERLDFFQQTWRVSVGTIALTLAAVSGLKICSYIMAKYSQRRTVPGGELGSRTPILNFSTQRKPIVRGWVFGIIFDGYGRWTVDNFVNPDLPFHIRHSFAATYKAGVYHASRAMTDIYERGGWQGLFGHNQMTEIALISAGGATAEGDVLVTCIRLASELLGRRYSLPEPLDPSALLAKREHCLWSEARDKVEAIGGYKNHRSAEFDRHILPLCKPLIEATSQRLAYDTAITGGVTRGIVDMFERICVEEHADWYALQGLIVPKSFAHDTAEAFEAITPVMLQHMEQGEEKDYVSAPIVSDEAWERFVQELPAYTHERASVGGYQPKL